MGWSISPNTGLASIDSYGRLTYSKHTSNQAYVIKFDNAECGEVVKSFTIFACPEQQCTCSTTGGLTVPATASETEVQVGTYSSSNCGGS
jgi:hypothetical protein